MANRGPVDVYYNLHKHKFSIKSRIEGRVIMHSDKVYCGQPSFIVQPAGRAKVIKEKKKNVHAFVRTNNWTIATTPKWIPEMKWEHVFYNPYKADYFYDINGYKVISAVQAKLVLVDKVPLMFAIGIEYDTGRETSKPIQK